MVLILMSKMSQNNWELDGLFDGAFDIVDAEFYPQASLRAL